MNKCFCSPGLVLTTLGVCALFLSILVAPVSAKVSPQEYHKEENEGGGTTTIRDENIIGGINPPNSNADTFTFGGTFEILK